MTFEGYTRVSEVCGFFSDLDKINPEVLKNAANRGTAVHNICTDIIEGRGKFGLVDEVKKYTVNNEGELNEAHFANELPQVESLVKSFEFWLEGFGKEVKFLKPSRFFDTDMMITGECDFIYEGCDGLVIVDLKTPASESPTWLLQGSAYSYLAKKHGYDVKQIEFVKLSKTGGFPNLYVYEEDMHLFKCCLTAYRYFCKNKNLQVSFDFL